MKPLQNRRAVITGAASGIGAAIAYAYADAGAKLVLCDRDAERLAVVANHCRDRGVLVIECVADVGSREGAQAGVDACVDALGGIDVLVNNAGMLTQASCVDLTQEMWDEMLRVDLTSVFVASQRALPHAGTEMGPHHKHRLSARHQRWRSTDSLCCRESRCNRIHQVPGFGSEQGQRLGQFCCSWSD